LINYRPAEIGMSLEDVDTPALLLDLDAFEYNIQLMADLVEKFKINHRPHAKTHKSPVIARKQIMAGAVGQCCQKVAEAEVLVAGGIDNVLISNQILVYALMILEIYMKLTSRLNALVHVSIFLLR
jgi:3-hydroxy-D-aspartate aldolase